MTQETVPHSSPKRKRSEPSTPKKPTPSKLSTTVTTSAAIAEDGAAESPRTQVSNRFEGLELDGCGVSKLDLTKELPKGLPQLDGGMDEMEKTTKRPKHTKFSIGQDIEIPETPQGLGVSFGDTTFASPFNELDPVVFKVVADVKAATGKLSKSYPSINRLSDSKSRGKKRLSTPPLTAGSDTIPPDAEFTYVDPDRASLTWHDDEITGFDPEDPDDDGEGINGVGFRPTAARVELRQQKKRQQLADYRSRESREARARRFEKRTASMTLSSAGSDGDEEERARRVRFSDSDANTMITI